MIKKGSIWTPQIGIAIKNFIRGVDPSISVSFTYPDSQLEKKKSQMAFLQLLSYREDSARKNNEDMIDLGVTSDNLHQTLEYIAIPYKLLFQLDLIFSTSKLDLDTFIIKLQGNLPKFFTLDVQDSKNNSTKTFGEIVEARYIPTEEKEFRYTLTLRIDGLLDEREPKLVKTVRDISLKINTDIGGSV